MTPQSLLRIARSVYSSPCYLATFDDEGDVLVELRTIHGGPVLTVSAETHEQLVRAQVRSRRGDGRGTRIRDADEARRGRREASVNDPKRVNPRFAAVAEELAPPPPPVPKVVADGKPGPRSRAIDMGQLPTVAEARGSDLGSIARGYGLVRRNGETDDELRARCQLLLGVDLGVDEAEPSAFGTELRRIRDGGRLCLLFEGLVLQPIQVDRSPYATQETYEGFDGNARLRITITREESMYNEPVYGANGRIGSIRRRGGY